jgi:hypothetical protein
MVKGLSESWDVSQIGGENFRAFGGEELQMRSVPANYADSFSTGEKIFSYDMAGVAARSENYVHKKVPPWSQSGWMLRREVRVQ